MNPTSESLLQLAGSAHSGPIAMLNLLRFSEEDCRSSYTRYAEVAARSINAVGGALMHYGIVESPEGWDSVALVYYPAIAAYLRMQQDPEYVEAIPHRTAGLSARVLYPFGLPAVSSKRAAELAHTGADQVEIRLSLAVDSNRTSHPGFPAIGNGLVSDQRWDALRIRPYRSDQLPTDNKTIETKILSTALEAP